MPYGLSDEVLARIVSVFSRQPEVDSVILYGSRAKGSHRPSSDIDLTMAGRNLSHDQLLTVELMLDDLLLPYKIDLSLYSQIDNSDLLAHIDRVGVSIFTRVG
jgi:predicted nucleotidyltransferase